MQNGQGAKHSSTAAYIMLFNFVSFPHCPLGFFYFVFDSTPSHFAHSSYSWGQETHFMQLFISQQLPNALIILECSFKQPLKILKSSIFLEEKN